MNLDCLFLILEFLSNDNITIKSLCKTCSEWNQFIMHSSICDRLVWKKKLDREFGVDFWGLGTGERSLVHENKWPLYSESIKPNISNLLAPNYYAQYFFVNIEEQIVASHQVLNELNTPQRSQSQKEDSYKKQYALLLFSSLVWLKFREEWWVNHILVTGVHRSGKTYFIEQVMTPILKQRGLKGHRIGSVYSFLRKDDEGYIFCESSLGFAKTPYFRGVELGLIIFVFDNTRLYSDEDWTKASLAFHGMMGEYGGASPKCIFYSNGVVHSREEINSVIGFQETNECYFYEHATTKFIENKDSYTLWAKMAYLLRTEY